MRATVAAGMLVALVTTAASADAGPLESVAYGVRLVAGKTVEAFAWLPKGASILLGAFARDVEGLATVTRPGRRGDGHAGSGERITGGVSGLRNRRCATGSATGDAGDAAPTDSLVSRTSDSGH